MHFNGLYFIGAAYRWVFDFSLSPGQLSDDDYVRRIRCILVGHRLRFLEYINLSTFQVKSDLLFSLEESIDSRYVAAIRGIFLFF